MKIGMKQKKKTTENKKISMFHNRKLHCPKMVNNSQFSPISRQWKLTQCSICASVGFCMFCSHFHILFPFLSSCLLSKCKTKSTTNNNHLLAHVGLGDNCGEEFESAGDNNNNNNDENNNAAPPLTKKESSHAILNIDYKEPLQISLT